MSDQKKPEPNKEDKFAPKNIDELIERLKKEKNEILANVAKKEKIFGEFDVLDAETKRLEEALKSEYETYVKIIKKVRIANNVYHVNLYELLFDNEKNRLADFKA